MSDNDRAIGELTANVTNLFKITERIVKRQDDQEKEIKSIKITQVRYLAYLSCGSGLIAVGWQIYQALN